jgi:transcriptional regulator with XRE-family HTH domain
VSNGQVNPPKGGYRIAIVSTSTSMMMDVSVNERVGRTLRQLRTDVGLSQGDVAGRLGVSQETISGYERGRPITTEALVALEEALGVARGTLFKAAGLCEENGDARAALERDPELDEAVRQVVLATYDSARETTRVNRAFRQGQSRVR